MTVGHDKHRRSGRLQCRNQPLHFLSDRDGGASEFYRLVAERMP